MALRLMLVGLVVGLGVDLPGGEDVASWARSGRDWLQARVDDALGGPEVADGAASDAEFAAIVDEMAGTFSADLASLGRPSEVGETETAQAAPADPEPTAGPGAAARLVAAVRLTGQAASAWWGVIRGFEASSVVR